MRPSITRRAGATLAILTTAALLAACAQAAPQAPAAPTPTAAEQTPSAEQTPTPSATAEPTAAPPADDESVTVTPPASDPADAGESDEVVTPEPPTMLIEDEPWVFETQNGTMRIDVPAEWTVTDSSAEVVNHDGRVQWDNGLRLESPEGLALHYYDGYGSDVGVVSEWSIVDRIEVAEGIEVIAWWDQWDAEVGAVLALASTTEDGRPYPHAQLDGVNRNHQAWLIDSELGPHMRFDSTAEAEAFLRGDRAQEAMQVLSTIELLPVDQYAMP
ncbi:hypothetical protein [Agrococcus sp. ARC_14]|uniref:hypothetical protein n=1 Tax=Agrococcus sp. ARC_14 TaxID=2919927 RepID=UPI001F061AA9|nr:hypothetical protein [Agrococcus sp. ARC_14]MCH1881887.1 hypothetical protein [Agrococcus sp. ARC_14]